MKIIDMAGKKFEKALVVSRAPNNSEKDTNARWHCRCDCGAEFIAYGQDLRRGKTKSCGCLTRSTIGARAAVFNATHGMSKTRLYRNWQSMHNRCNNEDKPTYLDVRVCERWSSFENFISDMGYPAAGLTLDRINPHGDYSPENCRWATAKTQANNRRKETIKLSHNGMTLTVEDWAKVLEISPQTIYTRMRKSFPPELLFSKRLRTKK